MPTTNDRSRHYSALSDPKRIGIPYALQDGPKSVSDLTTLLGLSQATTSRHLKTLRDRSLVTTQQDGVHVYYSLADERIIEALDLPGGVVGSALEQRKTLAEKVKDPEGFRSIIVQAIARTGA